MENTTKKRKSIVVTLLYQAESGQVSVMAQTTFSDGTVEAAPEQDIADIAGIAADAAAQSAQAKRLKQ